MREIGSPKSTISRGQNTTRYKYDLVARYNANYRQKSNPLIKARTSDQKLPINVTIKTLRLHNVHFFLPSLYIIYKL